MCFVSMNNHKMFLSSTSTGTSSSPREEEPLLRIGSELSSRRNRRIRRVFYGVRNDANGAAKELSAEFLLDKGDIHAMIREDVIHGLLLEAREICRLRKDQVAEQLCRGAAHASMRRLDEFLNCKSACQRALVAHRASIAMLEGLHSCNDLYVVGVELTPFLTTSS
jgi:hypothetical protein